MSRPLGCLCLGFHVAMTASVRTKLCATNLQPCKAWERACSRSQSPCRIRLPDLGPQEDRTGQRLAPNAADKKPWSVHSNLDGCTYRECNVSYRSNKVLTPCFEMSGQKQLGRCLWEEYVELSVEASTEGGQLWAAMRQSNSLHGFALTGLY